MKSHVLKMSIAAVASVLMASTLSTQVSASVVPQAAKCIKVKNVVGKNYQRAQDIWRAQGFVVLVAKDATGQGRLPWIDSHWFVTAQKPKAGTCVKKGSGVRATVKKYTD